MNLHDLVPLHPQDNVGRRAAAVAVAVAVAAVAGFFLKFIRFHDRQVNFDVA